MRSPAGFRPLAVAALVAYSTGVMRAAFASVPPGQREAAASRLHRMQAFRLAVLPQAPRVAVPPLMNEFISPLKATSLATVISLRELMTVASCAISASFRFLEWYASVLIYYLGMVSVLTVLQRGLEARLGAAHRR